MQSEPSTAELLQDRTRLLIAGASGSIGTAICHGLANHFEIVAVTHLHAREELHDSSLPVNWRHCDLFSQSELVQALSGVSQAIYLVQSRLPSARLDQAESEDMDLLIADNFARAACINGIRQILCLRGLLPEGGPPKESILRRNELVEVLESYGTPVTVIRAGLIVAPGSNVVNLIGSLVVRSPCVPIPQWTLRRKQPVAISDVLRAVRLCLDSPETYTGSFDIGGPEILNWRQILEQASELQGRKPRFLELPYLPPRVYAWWLRWCSPKTHPAAIRIVIDDLQFDALAQDNPLQGAISQGLLESKEAIRPFLENGERARLVNPRSRIMDIHQAQLRESNRVRSIQRVTLPATRDAAWIATTYFDWLQGFVWPLLVCRLDTSGSYRILLRGLGISLLELQFQADRSTPKRRMYFITGGLLASSTRNQRGRMEFRDLLNGRYTVIAIHDFAPALPWNFYEATQAAVHGFVMRAFQRFIEKTARR